MALSMNTPFAPRVASRARGAAARRTVLMLLAAFLAAGLPAIGLPAIGLGGPANGIFTQSAVWAAAAPPAFPGRTSDWHGFVRHDFEVGGHPAVVVAPREAAEGRPWVWHGEFFGHKPAPDIALLRRGYHLAYLRVPDLLGAPPAGKHWDAFYAELVGKYQLAPRVALVGLSRGGLYCYNWAIAHPDRVACIYGDAPVCDFKSWPGGRAQGGGKGKGSPRDWQLVLRHYGFANDAQALAYRGNPVDQLKPLAAAQVPLLHVYGDADSVVPWDENTGLLATRYRQLGGTIHLIAKPGGEHHPHGLTDPAPIVEFIDEHCRRALGQPLPAKGRDDPAGRLSAALEPDVKVVYRQFPDRELYLHVFHPSGLPSSGLPSSGPSKQPRPALLLFHGGGWGGGEPRRMYPFAAHFAARGWVGISVHYRRLNRRQGTTVFDCVEDARAALRFVRGNAAMLGVAPEKIVVAGASAGGHLAVETALLPLGDGAGRDGAGRDGAGDAAPAGLVLFFPVIDTSAEGYGQAKIGPRWRELSPVHQLRGPCPPTLILHGSQDTVTPLKGAQAFRERMEQLGNRCELKVSPGGEHGYLMFNAARYREALAQTEEFLQSLELLPVAGEE